MGVDVVVRPQLLAHHGDDPLLGGLGVFARGVEEIHLEQHIAPANDVIGQLGRQPFAQVVGEGVLGRARDHIGGRALQHGHMGGGPGHFRHQGHRRGPRADHHHPLAGIVQILRPMLRMDDAALEVGLAGKLRPIALGVVVIARAHEQEIAGDLGRLGAGPPVVIHRPVRFGRTPGGAPDLVAVADVPIDAEGLGRVLQIVEDRGAIGDGLGFLPGAKGKAQGVHVGVGADARIAEQVPGAPHGLAAFENRVGPPGAEGLQVIARADAGNPGADHQHVEMLHPDDLPQPMPDPPWLRHATDQRLLEPHCEQTWPG